MLPSFVPYLSSVTVREARGSKGLLRYLNLMLSRRERLGTADFAVAFANGRILRHPLLQLRVYKRSDKDSVTRAAFVVSKKQGKASLRNRVRRRIREIYRLSTARDDGRLAGLDLIFLATSAALTAETAQLQEAVEQLSRRALKVASS